MCQAYFCVLDAQDTTVINADKLLLFGAYISVLRYFLSDENKIK